MRTGALIGALVELIAPQECRGCRERISPDRRGIYRYICPMCLARASRTIRHREVMLRRFDGRARVKDAAAFTTYHHDSAMGRLVMACKYEGASRLAYQMGRLLGRELRDDPLLTNVDVIVPIPIHWIKRLKRGYNQSEAIAEGLSAETGLPVACLLKARHHHRTQTALSATQRSRNVKGIFRYRHTRRYHNARLLLLDDVCTTGATLAEAVNTIHASDSIATVSVLTFAMASAL